MKKWLSFILVSLSVAAPLLAQTEKINGVSFVAPSSEISAHQIITPKTVLNANYITLMPYAYILEDVSAIKFNTTWQWWGEKAEGTRKTIQLAKAQGLKVMVKPHVWIKHGSYTGHVTFTKSSDWLNFEESYSKYILNFAKIAEEEKAEVFCVGTEWEQFARTRPNFWFNLIKKIRTIYSGQLTYAANWDEYKRISFWKELDFIGVDAYFPLTDSETPSVAELKKALLPYKLELGNISKKHNKPILFTEFGYRSRSKSSERPWESDRGGEVNFEAQNNAYRAFFESFWNEKYIKGGFIWKWFSNHENEGGDKHTGFTPQNKPVEKVIKEWYSN
jgi:hypothetical protein